MDSIVCPLCRKDPVLHTDMLRNDLLRGIANGKGLPHRFQHSGIGKAGSQGINGQYPPGGHRLGIQRFKGWGGHIITNKISGHSAVENILLAILELLGGKFLIKKGEIQPGGVVCHLHPGDVQALADMGGTGGVHDHGLEAGRHIHLQLVNGHKAGAVFVPSGKMADQVTQGVNI